MKTRSVYTQTPLAEVGVASDVCASSVVFVRARRRVNPVICSAFLLIVPVGHGSKKANSFVIATTALANQLRHSQFIFQLLSLDLIACSKSLRLSNT